MCFVRQLPCLYPLPHLSHLSSPATDFLRSPRTKREPSLARRTRVFDLSGNIVERDGPSTSALEVLLPTDFGRPTPAEYAAGPVGLSPASCLILECGIVPSGGSAAAIAAIFTPPMDEELLRRLTRLAELAAPAERE